MFRTFCIIVTTILLGCVYFGAVYFWANRIINLNDVNNEIKGDKNDCPNEQYLTYYAPVVYSYAVIIAGIILILSYIPCLLSDWFDPFHKIFRIVFLGPLFVNTMIIRNILYITKTKLWGQYIGFVFYIRKLGFLYILNLTTWILGNTILSVLNNLRHPLEGL
jgi:hypothetical protein